VRESLELATHAYYLAEVVDLLTEDHQENRAVFDTLVQSLKALSQTTDARLVLVFFQLNLLDALGYRPELRECVSCRTAIQPERNYFAAQLGGVVCSSCGPAEPTAREIGTSALKLLRFVQATQGERGVNVPAPICREAEALLRDYAEHIVERRLRSPALIARIQDAGS
jgi:DNA repair protein RecO (recombination protein O)